MLCGLAILGEGNTSARCTDDTFLVKASGTCLGTLSKDDVVECRFFAGYGDEETAAALGLSDRTVRRDWLKARAWLRRELGDDELAADEDAMS